MSMPSYRERHKAAIVRIAHDILAEEGLEGLQARKVALAANCSVGTVYNLFGSLDMIALTANGETLRELHKELIHANGPPSGSLVDRLEVLAAAYLTFAIDRTPAWRALFAFRPSPKTPVPEWYQQAQEALFVIVEDLLQPVIAQQRSRREAARAVFSAVHGVIAIALDEKLGAFDRSATERQVTFIVRSIARGISINHRDLVDGW